MKIADLSKQWEFQLTNCTHLVSGISLSSVGILQKTIVFRRKSPFFLSSKMECGGVESNRQFLWSKGFLTMSWTLSSHYSLKYPLKHRDIWGCRGMGKARMLWSIDGNHYVHRNVSLEPTNGLPNHIQLLRILEASQSWNQLQQWIPAQLKLYPSLGNFLNVYKAHSDVQNKTLSPFLQVNMFIPSYSALSLLGGRGWSKEMLSTETVASRSVGNYFLLIRQ